MPGLVASPWNPLVSPLRYAPEMIQIHSEYLRSGGYRPFKVIQGNTKTLAHSDEPHMQKYGKFIETWFHELKHTKYESKMRLLKPNPTPLNDEARKPTRNAKRKGK